MTPLGKTPTKERTFIAIRCPACMATVNVGTEYKMAKCSCGHTWPWKQGAIRVTLAAGERRSGRRYDPEALEIE